MLSVNVDRDKAARFGLNIGDVQDTSQRDWRTGSRNLFEGDRRFDIVVRLSDTLRADPDVLARLPIPVPAVRANDRIDFIPLAELPRWNSCWDRTRSAVRMASVWWW